MRMVSEREIRVEGQFYGTVYSVAVVEYGAKLIYGYVLIEDGEERHLISVDFGFEHIQCAINACLAEVLKGLYRVDEQANVLALD